MKERIYSLKQVPLNSRPYEDFCEKYKKQLTRTFYFEEIGGLDTEAITPYEISIFWLKNSILFLREGNDQDPELIIASKGNMEKVVQKIELKGFKLEEIIEEDT